MRRGKGRGTGIVVGVGLVTAAGCGTARRGADDDPGALRGELERQVLAAVHKNSSTLGRPSAIECRPSSEAWQCVLRSGDRTYKMRVELDRHSGRWASDPVAPKVHGEFTSGESFFGCCVR